MNTPSGMIYVADASATVALSTTAAKLALFTTNGHDEAAVGGDLSVNADAANDKIIVGSPGVYLVSFSASVSIATANLLVNFALRVGAVEQAHLQCQYAEDVTDTGAAHSLSFTGLVNITESQMTAGVVDVEVYVESGSGTPTLTVVQAQLTMVRLA